MSAENLLLWARALNDKPMRYSRSVTEEQRAVIFSSTRGLVSHGAAYSVAIGPRASSEQTDIGAWRTLREATAGNWLTSVAHRLRAYGYSGQVRTPDTWLLPNYLLTYEPWQSCEVLDCDLDIEPLKYGLTEYVLESQELFASAEAVKWVRHISSQPEARPSEHAELEYQPSQELVREFLSAVPGIDDPYVAQFLSEGEGPEQVDREELEQAARDRLKEFVFELLGSYASELAEGGEVSAPILTEGGRLVRALQTRAVYEFGIDLMDAPPFLHALAADLRNAAASEAIAALWGSLRTEDGLPTLMIASRRTDAPSRIRAQRSGDSRA